MTRNKHILLIIISLFLILNGVFAFEHNLIIILMSISFILIGIILFIISIRLFLKHSSNN